jgi:hypothetical protein
VLFLHQTTQALVGLVHLVKLGLFVEGSLKGSSYSFDGVDVSLVEVSLSLVLVFFVEEAQDSEQLIASELPRHYYDWHHCDR